MAENWKPDQVIIGEKIKEARKRAHMTQDQLAEEIGGTCTNKVISRYEKGTVEMGVQTLIDVAEALEIPVDNLMPERVRVLLFRLPGEWQVCSDRPFCRSQGSGQAATLP